ncbi:MAG: caspase family protein [Deltaproteobacteria bacterium]|nr:caspase family protein [Deltaproteobacteria bacterium]
MKPSPTMARAGPLLTAFLLAALPAEAAAQHRFAVFAGNDRGGGDTRPLRYAADDARKMHAVLTQLGGVAPDDALLILNQAAGEFWRALSAIETRIALARQHGERTLLLVYYSGHAKDGELRLGESRIRLDEVKARLLAGQADIRIGVFDSCRAGALNRTKGARRAPAFAIEASGSEEARGLVMLSSASADEDAQESDEIGGSYFSHYLVSGLRGDADRSRDRRVTLSEAYAYAYARTVADTAESAAGAQHPTFSYDLKGNADLVLTDFGSRHEGIYVPGEAPAGIYYVVDSNGFIAAEIQKPAGMDRQLALPSGRYRVRRRLADRLRIGEIQIVAGQLATLDETSLRDAPFSDDPVKGAMRDETGVRTSLGLGGLVQSFFDGPTRDGLFPPTGMLGIELELRDFFRRGWTWGFDFASGSTRAKVDRYGTLLPFRFSELTAGTAVAKEWRFGEGRFSASAGLRLAFVLMGRKFDEPTVPDQFFATFTPGLVGSARYRITKHFAMLGRGRVHYLLYNVDENRSLGYWELTLGVAYEF